VLLVSLALLVQAAQRAHIDRWDFLGPFQCGKTEIDGSPVDITKVAVGDRAKYFSELSNNGKVGWSTVGKGEAQIRVAPQIDWNKIVQGVNSLEVYKFQGWAVSSVVVEESGNFVLSCTGVHTIQFDDDMFIHGDIYSTSQIYQPLSLSRGTHTMRIRVMAKGEVVFQCKLKPTQSFNSLLKIYPPKFAPDLLDGRQLGSWLQVGVTNLDTSPLHDLRFTVPDGSAKLVDSGESDNGKNGSLAPGQTRMYRLQFLVEAVGEKGEKEQCLRFPLMVQAAKGGKGGEEEDARLHAQTAVVLRCRHSAQSFVFSFVDHDGSVAVAAAIKPQQPCASGGGCPVVLTLSGVGATPMSQADSYKYVPKTKKKKKKQKKKGNKKQQQGEDEWRFGLDTAWILAPERAGAHNWEGVGHLSALAALAALNTLGPVSGHPSMAGYDADVQRVLYAGHSRGGHGAMLLATHQPERCIGLQMAAGWINREDYGDANGK
jgi:hypothetical protein